MQDMKELFQYKIFSQECESAFVSFAEECDMEFYKFTIIAGGEKLCFESVRKPVGEYWVQLFDSRRTGDINQTVMALDTFRYEMHVGQRDKLTRLSSKDIKLEIQKCIARYKELVISHPAFLVIYKPVHAYIHALIQVAEQDRSHTNVFELFEDAQDKLMAEIQSFIDRYKAYDRYIFDCLVAPYQNNKTFSTGFVVAAYEKWQMENNIKKHISIFEDAKGRNWDAVIGYFQVEENTAGLLEQDETIHFDDNLQELFVKGVRHFMDNNLIFRICPVCQRYFVTKSVLHIKYCTREFRDGKTCQEIGIRNAYLAKKAADPIHSAYLCEYNKRYARVRRKSISAEDAKIEELRALRDEYQRKYNAFEGEKIQAEILEEFYTAMKRL